MAKSRGKAKIKATEEQSTSKTTRCPFKVGTLVTGKDRSYQRSIYKYVSPCTPDRPGYGVYEFVSLNGNTKDYLISQGHKASFISVREHIEFRRAKWMEIKKSSTNSHIELMLFLRKIGATESLHSKHVRILKLS